MTMVLFYASLNTQILILVFVQLVQLLCEKDNLVITLLIVLLTNLELDLPLVDAAGILISKCTVTYCQVMMNG